MMSREAVDLELPQRASADQEAWLEATRIAVRSIRFASCGAALHERRAGPQLTSEALATSTDMLAASTHTLEVCGLRGWEGTWFRSSATGHLTYQFSTCCCCCCS